MLTKWRQAILRRFVPEFIWPKQVTIDNVSFKIRNTPYSFGIKYMLVRTPEAYESSERAFLDRLMPGDHVLELGSSIGILTRLIKERIGDDGKLLAVEASSSLTAFSAGWLEQLSNVKVINKFAFPVYHRIPFSISFDDTKGSLGGTVTFKEGDDSNSHDKFYLEDAERQFDVRPTVLFCDIEGSEIALLHKDASLPLYLRLIIIELHPSIYSASKTLMIIEKIREMDFVLVSALHSVYLFKRKLSSSMNE